MYQRKRNTLIVSRQVLLYYLTILLYRAMLDIIYDRVISVYYAYAGFISNKSMPIVVLSLVVLSIFAVISREFYINKAKKQSYEILFTLMLISIVPFTTMIAFGVCNLSFTIANTSFWLFFCFFTSHIKWGTKRIRFQKEPTKTLGDTQIQLFSLLLFLVVLYISGRYAGFRFNFSLLNVYDYRAEARSNQLPTILLYLFSWSRMLNAIFIAYFIQRKKWGWMAMGILAQLLSFGYDGSKTTLMLMVAVVIVNILPRLSTRQINKWMFWGIVGLSAICLIWYLVSGDYILISIFVRRVLFIPVQIATYYWDFFTTHIPDFFRQSFLRYFGFTSPYQTIPYLIGDVYYQRVTSANNGLISDAVTNLGVGGLILMPLFYSFIFSLLDKSAEGLDERLYITVALYVAITMTNSFIFTILLTHGLLITMLILSTMKRDTIKAYELNQPKR